MLHAAGQRQPLAHDLSEPGEGSGPAGDHRSLVLRLQATAGNRAVAALLAPPVAQRQVETAPPPAPTGAEPMDAAVEAGRDDVDAALEAVLAEIDAMLPSAPRVPAFEAVTATTAGEYSRGELERDIGRLWRREQLVFSEAARRVAGQGDERRGPRATASPTVAPDAAYALRWSINLFAADYPRTRSDLPDVARIARRGSPFQRAIAAEFSRATTVMNPTGRRIEGAIMDGIIEMWRTLEPGAAGQIVVTFSGHGGNGSIDGVDWVAVGPDRLRGLARFAADFNVHLVFVLDTCRAGLLASFAAADAMAEAERRLAGLPADRQQAARARAELARRLGRGLFALNSAVIAAGDATRAVSRARTAANRLAAFEAFRAVISANGSLGELLQDADPRISGIGPLRDAHNRLELAAIVALGGNRAGMTAALRAAATVLDLGQDVINGIIDALNAETAGASAPTDGAATPGGDGAGAVR